VKTNTTIEVCKISAQKLYENTLFCSVFNNYGRENAVITAFQESILMKKDVSCMSANTKDTL